MPQVDEQDGSGCTPLHVAAAVGHAGVVRALLAHGARASALDPRGSTPLHAAALHAHLEVSEEEKPAAFFERSSCFLMKEVF